MVVFDPMTETETARRQIIELRQIGRVIGYIQKFYILRYKILGMIELEDYMLLPHELEAGIQQQSGFHAQLLQETMELAEHANLYSE